MTKRSAYSILLLIIFHAIGIILFHNDPSASRLSYITILLTASLVLLNDRPLKKLAIPYLVIFTGGYLIELAGVSTGVLFGEYEYDTSLGFKLAGVPLMIGINWLIVVRSSTEVAHAFPINSFLVKALLAGGLATALDYVIEPIAIKYSFWHWDTVDIPMWNYICWFIFSFLFSFIILKHKPLRNNVAFVVYIIWIVFFIILKYI